MAFTLITANRNYSSWSLRPWLLMKALGIAFEERVEPFTKADNYDDFRSFSPTGQVPVLLDGERDDLGFARHHALPRRSLSAGLAGRRGRTRLGPCARSTEMHGGFGAVRSDCTMNVGVRVTPKPPSPTLARQVARLGELWAEGLSRFGGPWLAGAGFYRRRRLLCAGRFPRSDLRPRCRRGRQALGRRKSSIIPRSANGKLSRWPEPWREADHEAELAAAGTIIADYRAG